MDWDGEVIYQFSGAARHREVAESLPAAGKAYHCYATPEELTAIVKARAEGRTRLYNGLGATAIPPKPGRDEADDRWVVFSPVSTVSRRAGES